MRKLLSLLLLAIAGGCVLPPPYVPPVIVPPVPPVVVPPVPPQPVPHRATWAALQALQARAEATGAVVTEVDAVAALGHTGLPAPYTAANGDRVLSWDVTGVDGTAVLKVHVHFKDGKMLLPVVVE